MLSPLSILVVAVVGVLIGSVGIGGVLLVPTLKYLGGISLHTAIPACMFSYIFTGLVGGFIYSRHVSIEWSLAIKVCLGALPGAYIGALLLPYFSVLALELAIAVLILGSGIHAIQQTGNNKGNSVSAYGFELVLIGMITGIGSALTGTGGPLLLVPILIWRKVPILTAIGLSQVIQIPISLMATVGNEIYGQVDYKLGFTLALILSAGVILGALTSNKLPVNILKKIVSGLLILVGTAMLYRLITQL
jgi:uncharacterized membrane protein YfcA